MANLATRLAVQFTDVNGDEATTTFDLGDVVDTTTMATISGQATTLAGLLQAASNAKVTQISWSVIVSRAQISTATAPPPASDTYPSVTDGARLQFADTAGIRRFLQIPAPLLSDFRSGSNIVDPDNANVSPIITWVTANGAGPENTNLYEGGAKVGRRARRRVAHRAL